ncbi:MAG: hypothetical protein ABJA71_16295, partial [Ginsengibacter sp.]
MKKFVLYFSTGILLIACSQKNKENKIVTENLLPGTTDWLINVKYDTCPPPDHRYCRRPQIEGYCSQTSVSQGDSLNLYVSTNPASQFTIDIYRMGYYGGKGGNLKKHIDSLQGKEQRSPDPDPKPNFFECNWDKTYQLV